MSKAPGRNGSYDWHTCLGSSRDVRDVISISKLIRRDDGPEEIQAIIKTLAKYGAQR